MKRIVFFLFALSFLIPARAQQVQNKPFDVTLRDYTIDEIVRLFGKPTQIDSNLIDCGLAVEYPHATFYYVGVWEHLDGEIPEGAPDKYVPDGFWTDSPDFCILSDCFPGGIRVGDRIERIRNLDIVHSRPGKGRERNGLRKVESYEDHVYYLMLGEEFDHFYLNVKDSVVCAIDWETPKDWDRPEGGVLWRVEGKDLPAPSYILGVFPHAPADVCQRIYGLADAWKSVRKVYWQDPDQGPWGRKMIDGAMPELPDGKDDMATHLYKNALEDGKEAYILPPRFTDITSRYPEGEPEVAKERIRHLYEAYLQEDLEEICWTLNQDDSDLNNVVLDYPTDWSKELGQAIREAPTLIIVDFTNLRYRDLMIGMVDGMNHYIVQPVKSPEKLAFFRRFCVFL